MRVKKELPLGAAQPVNWPRPNLLSSHGQVLLCIAEAGDILLTEVADRIGLTTRSVSSLIDDLERGGYVVRTRVGRRNSYAVQTDKPLTDLDSLSCSVGDLLALLTTVQPAPGWVVEHKAAATASV